MKDKILNRIKELTEELESIMKERAKHIKALKIMDQRTTELSASIIELKNLLDGEED